MPKEAVPLLAYNRGLISPNAVARVDVERTRLAATTMTNWLPKSLGPMTLRPGTKYLGTTLSNLVAHFIECIPSTDSPSMIEVTNFNARFWLSDTQLVRVGVSPTIPDVTTGTGFANVSTGGGTATYDASFGLYLTGVANGSVAKVDGLCTIGGSDSGKEHSLLITIIDGPVTFRVGSASGTQDLVNETILRTGRHSIAFTPTSNFYIGFSSQKRYAVNVRSMIVGPATYVDLPAPWTTANVSTNGVTALQYDQSADVIYVACAGTKQFQIERRGTGRSWSVVHYNSDNGPFLPGRTSEVRLKLAGMYGDTTLTADKSFFLSTHAGALFRLYQSGQSQTFVCGFADVFSRVWEVTGVGATTERRTTIVTTGTWTANLRVQRSFDGPDYGFKTVATITTNTTTNVDDADDNLTVWYRLGIPTGDFTSGGVIASIAYSGGVTRVNCRVTAYTSATVVNVRLFDLAASTDWTSDWNEGAWSDVQGWPSSVQLHDGRLWWAGGAQVFGSVSDDYENFDDATEGDSAPVIRALGKGPVDSIGFMISGARLLLGTASGVIAMASTGLGEPLTQSNARAAPVETRGAAAIRAILLDTRIMFLHRSKQRIYSLGYDVTAGDYIPSDISKLVPDLLAGGVVHVAVQRYPDTRVHCVMADGTVALLTYDEQEDILCWSKWTTTNGLVEKAMVLPSTNTGDAVYYVVKRLINGSTARFLERWADETDCIGGTRNWQADSALSVANGPGVTTVTAGHLIGESVVLWADGISQSPITDAEVQTTFTVGGGGTFTASSVPALGVVGLPYNAVHVSTKMAYGAALGTALTQLKRIDHVGFILANTHQRGLFFGRDESHLDPLPRVVNDVAVTANQIHATLDLSPVPFPGKFDTDSRVCLKAYAPHPCTVLATTAILATHEKA